MGHSWTIARRWSCALHRPVAAGLFLGLVDGVIGLGQHTRVSLPGAAALFLCAWAVAVPTAAVLWALAEGILRLVGAYGRTYGADDPRRDRHGILRPKLVPWVAALCAGAMCGWSLWGLSGGRRLAEHPYRWAMVLIGAAIALGCTKVLLGVVLAARSRAPRATALGLAVLSTVAMVADALWMKRLYPDAHRLLVALGLSLAALAAWSWPRLAPNRVTIWLPPMIIAAALAAFAFVIPAVSRGTTGFLLEEGLPLAGKWATLIRTHRTRPAEERGPAKPGPAALPDASVPSDGIRFRSGDVLLITIDALRADTLAALGGSGATPEIDRLAAQGALFSRAYTPAPHTSYALTSLMTGTDVRTALEVTATASLTPLPTVLRAEGYSTYAFFPPAVFHVDGERLATLRDGHLGFEHVTSSFGSAEERVRQMAMAIPGRMGAEGPPVFAWVHLFEPHEPYEGTNDGGADDPKSRYLVEVSRADRAVGDLVRTFWEGRPGATVIIASDHGEEFGEHGGRFHGTTVFDEQVRIPLILVAPDAIPPQRLGAPVDLTDVVPTLLAGLGMTASPSTTGDNLLPYLSDQARHPEVTYARVADAFMITDGRYKALCRAGQSNCLLFDLLRDPSETVDVGPEHPRTVQHLFRRYGRMRSSIAIAQESDRWARILARATLGDGQVRDDVRSAILQPTSQEHFISAVRVAPHLNLQDTTSRLREVVDENPDPTVRREVLLTLVRLGDGTAIGPLQRILATSSVDRDFGERAAFALAHGGHGGGESLLLELAADEAVPGDRRREAISALAGVATASHVRPLCRLLPNDNLRVQVAQTLGSIGSPRAVPCLRRALRVERYDAGRDALTDALARLRGRVAR